MEYVKSLGMIMSPAVTDSVNSRMRLQKHAPSYFFVIANTLLTLSRDGVNEVMQ